MKSKQRDSFMMVSWSTLVELEKYLSKQWLDRGKYPLVYRMMRDIHEVQSNSSGSEKGYHKGTVVLERKDRAARARDDRRRNSEALLPPKEGRSSKGTSKRNRNVKK